MIVPRGIGAFHRGMGGLVQDLAAAISRQEGANPSYNNPGNLRAGPGQVGTSPNGIAIFPDAATGEAALERQIQLNIDRGLTLQEFFAGQRDASGKVIPGGYFGYAPAADSNQPNVYASNVSQWAGIPANVPLSSLMSGIPTSGASDSGSWDSSGDTAGSSDDGSGWYWAAAIGGAVILALALE